MMCQCGSAMTLEEDGRVWAYYGCSRFCEEWVFLKELGLRQGSSLPNCWPMPEHSEALLFSRGVTSVEVRCWSCGHTVELTTDKLPSGILRHDFERRANFTLLPTVILCQVANTSVLHLTHSSRWKLGIRHGSSITEQNRQMTARSPNC